MNKAQAARLLGVSVRTLQRYMSQHKIAFTMRRTKAGEEAVFDREELQRFKAELKTLDTTVHAALTPLQNMDTPITLSDNIKQQPALAPIDLIEQLAHLVQHIQRPNSLQQTVPIENKLMLSLKEASEFSGISQYKLKWAIKLDELKTIRGIGRGYGKIRRDDLIEYVKNLK